MLCGEISQNKRGSQRGDPWKPCVIPLEEGNQSLWIRQRKKIKKEKKMRERHVARRKVGGNFPLESSWIDLVGEKEKKRKEKERKEKKEEGKWSEKLYLLSKIYGDRAVGFRQSKRQSSSTQRELHVGIRMWGFRQTPRCRGFSPTLVILGLRVI